MRIEYISFEYGNLKGEYQTREQFYALHGAFLSPEQINRMEQNLEVQCTVILRKLWYKPATKNIKLHFLYKDKETQELYLRPLDIDLRVYIKTTTNLILVYDIRRVGR